MVFVDPSILRLLFLLPLAVVFLLWRAWAREMGLRRLGDTDLLRLLSPRISRPRRLLKAILWLLTIGSVIFALSRPIWGVEVEVIETQGVVVMVVLDVSLSMDAEDVLPSRLERAKFTLHDLIVGLEGNALGLILVAGDAFVLFPPTTDTFSALSFLDSINTGSLTRQGTVMEDAIRLAMKPFAARPRDQRVVILLTDGETHDEELMLVAVDEAVEQGVAIHTIGYGDPDQGATIPIRDIDGNLAGYKQDRAGNLVLTHFDEVILRVIADRTGGIYLPAADDGSEVVALLDSIDDLDGGSLGDQTTTRPVERFAIFTGLALLFLSLEMLLPETDGPQVGS